MSDEKPICIEMILFCDQKFLPTGAILRLTSFLSRTFRRDALLPDADRLPTFRSIRPFPRRHRHMETVEYDRPEHDRAGDVHSIVHRQSVGENPDERWSATMRDGSVHA